MADPGCFKCKYFYGGDFQQDAEPEQRAGECHDPSKRIYPRRGVPSDVSAPDTYGYMTCDNWTAIDAENEGLAGDA